MPNNGNDNEEKYAALISNANAIRVLASTIEGTIGPKGLDTMLVDSYGDVLITNAGVTILEKMDVNHPAARMLIKVAQGQQEEIGDGTTTATLLASALISAGVEQILRGVPVTRVIEGVRSGISKALQVLANKAKPLSADDKENLTKIALIAGREHEDIANLVVEAASLVGETKLKDLSFRLAETVTARVGVSNEVFLGVIIDKERLNREMPEQVTHASILTLGDALEPEELSTEAQSTESGFTHFLNLRQEFRDQLDKIIHLGVKVVLCEKSVDGQAEEVLGDAGIMVVSRVSQKTLQRVAEHVGSRIVKRSSLKRSSDDLMKAIGRADLVVQEERYGQIRVIGGNGFPAATLLVGAATAEIVGERERIAKDASSAVQAAVRGGIVPGGGAIEFYLSGVLSSERLQHKGMSAYGVDCVSEALKRPLAQIVTNAGYNPLEKSEEVAAAQASADSEVLAIDCDTGLVCDMLELGVIDPALVKQHALKAAGEIAEAILRIETIIKKREDGVNSF